MGIIQRRRALLVFLFPFLASEIYATLAWLFHGRLAGHALLASDSVFASVQIALIGYLVYRVRAAGLAASALAVFSVSYAFFAWFVAGMAFTDTYL